MRAPKVWTPTAVEWHLELPLHHYIHVISGMAEFFLVTTALVLAERRTRGQATHEAHAFRILLKGLIVGYPLLGAAYLTDRLGTLVEPVFFAIFSGTIITELFEPVALGQDRGMCGGPGSSSWGRSLARTGMIPLSRAAITVTIARPAIRP